MCSLKYLAFLFQYWNIYKYFYSLQEIIAPRTRLQEIFFYTGFLVYSVIVVVLVGVLIFYFALHNGRTYKIVYIGICSLIGSITVCLLKFGIIFNYRIIVQVLISLIPVINMCRLCVSKLWVLPWSWHSEEITSLNFLKYGSSP